MVIGVALIDVIGVVLIGVGVVLIGVIGVVSVAAIITDRGRRCPLRFCATCPLKHHRRAPSRRDKAPVLAKGHHRRSRTWIL